MSIEALAFAKALDLGTLETPQTRLLIYVIAENTWNDTFSCRLHQDQMAYEAGRVSVRTIQRHIADLVAGGLLQRVSRRSAHGYVLMDTLQLSGFQGWYERDHKKRPQKTKKADDKSSRDQGHEKPLPDKLSGSENGLPDNLSGSENQLPDKLSGSRKIRRLTGRQIVRQLGDTTCHLTGRQQVAGDKEPSRVFLPDSPPSPPVRCEASEAGAASLGGKAEDQVQAQAGQGPSGGITPSLPSATGGHEPSQAVGAPNGAIRFAKGWDEDARDAVEVLAGSAHSRHVVAGLIALVAGTLSPPRSADGASFVEQLGRQLAGYRAETLQRVADKLLAGDAAHKIEARKYDLPSVVDIAKLADRISLTATAVQAADVARRAIDPALAVGWAEVSRELTARFGQAVFESWFASAAPVSVAGGSLTLDAGSPMHRKWISQNYELALEAAAHRVWGVDRVRVITGAAR